MPVSLTQVGSSRALPLWVIMGLKVAEIYQQVQSPSAQQIALQSVPEERESILRQCEEHTSSLQALAELPTCSAADVADSRSFDFATAIGAVIGRQGLDVVRCIVRQQWRRHFICTCAGAGWWFECGCGHRLAQQHGCDQCSW